MKILLVMSRPEREELIMKKIQQRINEIDKNIEVAIIYRFSQEFIHMVLKFKPNVIMTFPMNGVGEGEFYNIIKFITKCSIISFRTEGMLDLNSKNDILLSVGEIKEYDEKLVDYEIFWGPKIANILGEELLKQRRLSSEDKIIVAGYPMYEAYFSKEKQDDSYLDSNIKERIHKYDKKNILFFATGFHVGDEPEENKKSSCLMISNSHKEYKKIYNDYKMELNELENFREKFKKTIINIAENNKDKLIIVKLHPVEINIITIFNKEPFKEFKDYENIIYLNYSLPMNNLLSYCGVFFHIGSTSLMEAYMSKIPAIYITYKSLQYSEKFIPLAYKKHPVPSTKEVDIDKLEECFYDYVNNGIEFHPYKEMDEALFDYFNIIPNDNNYEPSKKIAEVLINCCAPNDNILDKNNQYLKNSIKNKGLIVAKECFHCFFECIQLNDYYGAIYYINQINDIVSVLDITNLKIDCLGYFNSILKEKTIKYKAIEFKYNKQILINSLTFEKEFIKTIEGYNELKVCIFGTGKLGDEVFNLLDLIKKHNGNKIEVVGFLDNNKEKWGSYIKNINVFEPGIYLDDVTDKIIIASMWSKDIKEQLLELGFEEKNFLIANYREV